MEMTVPRTAALLSAVLMESGHDVTIHDRNVDDSFEMALRKFGGDVICFSCTTTNVNDGLKCASMAKSYGDFFTVFGGVHPTVDSQRLIEMSQVDAVIEGEAEDIISSIIIDKKKGVHRGTPADLDNLPLPAYDLLDTPKYDRAYIMSSRGCPNRCTFCSTHTISGMKIRYMRPEKIVDEMEALKSFGFKYVWFADDSFTVNRARVLELCGEIKRRKLKMDWYCQTRVNTIDKELLVEMKSAGCTMINMGIESGDEKILKKINKNIKIADVIHAFKIAKEAGLKRTAFFMVGFRGQDMESVMKSKRLLELVKPDITAVAILCPYPDTQIYQEMKEMGLFSGNEDWSEFRIRTGSGLSSDYILGKVSEYSGMSVPDLIEAYNVLKATGDRITFRKKITSPKHIISFTSRRLNRVFKKKNSHV